MDVETVFSWLAAGEGERTEFKEKYTSRRETPEAYEASPCPAAAWTDLDDAALRKYFSARAPGVLDQPPEFASDGQHFRVTMPSRHVKLR